MSTVSGPPSATREMPINTIQNHTSHQHRHLFPLHFTASSQISSAMSSTCGNCDCADKTQCVKKGNNYGIVIMETEKISYMDEMVEVAENDPNCKCTSNCSCAGCNCGK